MVQMYASRRTSKGVPNAEPAAPAEQSGLSSRTPSTLSAKQTGHRVDLPEEIRSKMEASFGADLSGVEIFESQAVEAAGAQAVTMGNKIGFAPGKLDFASSGGQALLGHELSHVVTQARGEVTGSGFLNDTALEARADREGAMAAAGQSVYTGEVTPLSGSSVAAASGPMQAKKGKKKDAAPAPQPADLQKYFPAIGARDTVLAQVEQARTQQRNAAQAYALANGFMTPQKEADGTDRSINGTDGGRQFLSLFRPGDDAYNATLGSLWTADNGLRADLSEDEMMAKYQAISLPLHQQLDQYDPAQMQPTDSAVRANFLTNNELVGRLNSLGDIRKAIAARTKGKQTTSQIQQATIQAQGLDAAKLTKMAITPGVLGKKMQKAMGVQGRMDTAYKNVLAGNNDPELGANPAYDDDLAAGRILPPQRAVGTKTSDATMAYRHHLPSDDTVLDPTTASDDDKLGLLYQRIKEKQKDPNADPDELSQLRRLFSEIRAGQIGK